MNLALDTNRYTDLANGVTEVVSVLNAPLPRSRPLEDGH